ncbi:phytoene desaturase family protein [Sphingomicrobium sediminis]|uniref:Pyridine nucleotide-disulfide oxidoreductase domain-containing protein 2 n=1 Tax=Sphingomicrobium sediminis TaxID=2950949 RepID=A0A9X2J1F3_9SPHN|nr:NAD(P)/FAD-dependent oxidoreductase [Sphingomicrobium sediminis]MCM8557198.1 NAD(P)/FAD-dependent oxidoreductase [Sphingomicrobium sediminis]
MHDAVIIGAGHNGLTCAYYLAKKGLDVLLVEAADKVGGAAVTDEFHPGYRNSAASYTVSLLQPKIIRDMELERHGLEVVLRKVDNFLPTVGSDYLLAGRDGLTRSELARHHKADGPAYDAYEAELDVLVRLVRKWMLKAPPRAQKSVGNLTDWLRLARDVVGMNQAEVETLAAFFTKSAGDILDARFEGELAKALFGFDGIVGHFASPYDPGTAYVLLHHLLGEANGVQGAWGHAIGGMGAITEAMARAVREAGGDIRVNSPVSEVIVEKGRAAGVVVGGKPIRARTVISNANPRLLSEHLLPEDAFPKAARQHYRNWACESATFRMNVALKRLPNFTSLPGRGNHLTAGIIMSPSLDHMARAHASAVLDGWSTDPVIEMLVPTTLDPSLAPKHGHVASLFCQHFRYKLPGNTPWEAVREQAADHIIATVDRYAPGFAESVIARQVHSPADLESRFGLIGGDIFHGKITMDQIFSARPRLGDDSYRMPLDGLYLCGSGAHPGGGVTGAPGHNAARAVLADKRKWRKAA